MQARWLGSTVAVKILRQADESGLGDFRTELNVLQKVPGNIGAEILRHLDPSHQRLLDHLPQCCASASAVRFPAVLRLNRSAVPSLVGTWRG